MLDKLVSSELETTRLTQDEIRNGCWLTMEQELLRHNKPHLLDSDRRLERTITQQSIAFQYTVSVPGMHISRSPMIDAIETMHSNLSKSLDVNRLWLEVGRTYSNFSKYDFTAAINSTWSRFEPKYWKLASVCFASSNFRSTRSSQSDGRLFGGL